ncbi:hypothetical protein Prudu_004119 [Prunus dulcis]|uniref:Uncharacterized protein n=1 Tax=Prunus dulcis TaxID=3755 RepID=A0A4Y1QUK6_PRUDU|nr:hypothetical protein Prudu_004119 [Prunus dulcis]
MANVIWVKCSFWIHKMGKKSKSKTPREMQDNTAAVEEENPSSSAKKLLNHWLRFSSGHELKNE